MQQHGGKYIPRSTPPHDLGVGSKVQNLTSSEHGHVAYQSKGIDECINMQAHILSLYTSLTPGVKTFFK